MLTRLVPSLLKLPVRSLSSQMNVCIDRADEAYFIKLNKQQLVTPMKNKLRLPDETLALAIANEWKASLAKKKKNKKKLDLANMHLTTLAYTAIDNPFNDPDEHIIDSIIEYLKFDTVRFRDVDNEELLQKQSRHWDPLVGWFEHKFKCHLPIEYGALTNTSSLPQATHDTILRYLQSHDRWALVGIDFMTQNLKSFVLTASLADRFLSVEQAVELARLETRHQTEKWSKVEWEHDLDEQCTNARVSAGCLFYHLSLPNGATGGEQVASVPRKDQRKLPKEFHKNKILTIPNALTFSRIATAPAIGYLIWNGMYPHALGCFAFAAATDLFDGLLARLLKQQSALGAMMDPLADKLLLTTSFIAMYNTGLMPLWCIKIYILKDLVLLLAGAAIRYNGFTERPTLRKYFDLSNYPTYGFEPTILSKVNTALQCSLILTHLMTYQLVGNSIYDSSMFAFQLTTAVTTGLSLGQYLKRFAHTYLFFSYPKKVNHHDP